MDEEPKTKADRAEEASDGVEEPSWLHDSRRIRTPGGKVFWAPPSERRIADRRYLHALLKSDASPKHRIDDIITYFRQQYEGVKWGGLSKKSRRLLYHQERGLCYWCKKPISIGDFTIEHLKPRSDGGEDTWENYAIAHHFCNHSRPDQLLVDLGFINPDGSPVHTEPHEKENNENPTI